MFTIEHLCHLFSIFSNRYETFPLWPVKISPEGGPGLNIAAPFFAKT
jgi:hypothetical protein